LVALQPLGGDAALADLLLAADAPLLAIQTTAIGVDHFVPRQGEEKRLEAFGVRDRTARVQLLEKRGPNILNHVVHAEPRPKRTVQFLANYGDDLVAIALDQLLRRHGRAFPELL